MSPAPMAPPPASSSKSPPTTLQSLSLGLLPPSRTDHHDPIQIQTETAAIGRVKLSDIAPFEGSPNGNYINAVEVLSGSLMRYNAVVIEIGVEESVVMRCALESVRMFFKAREQYGKLGRGFYTYRAGRYKKEPCAKRERRHAVGGSEAKLKEDQRVATQPEPQPEEESEENKAKKEQHHNQNQRGSPAT